MFPPHIIYKCTQTLVIWISTHWSGNGCTASYHDTFASDNKKSEGNSNKVSERVITTENWITKFKNKNKNQTETF